MNQNNFNQAAQAEQAEIIADKTVLNALYTEELPAVDQLLEAFQQTREALNRENAVLSELLQKQNKNRATLSALQTELNDLANTAKAKIDENNEVSIDDFVKFRTTESALKAKIEYFTLASEELEIKIDGQCETVYGIKYRYISQREEIALEKGRVLLSEFVEEHKAKLNEIMQLLEFSEKLTTRDIYSGKTSDRRAEFIYNVIHRATNFENKEVIKPYLLPELVLDQYYQPKLPTRKHAEKFNQQPKGFQRLIQEMNQ